MNESAAVVTIDSEFLSVSPRSYDLITGFGTLRPTTYRRVTNETTETIVVISNKIFYNMTSFVLIKKWLFFLRFRLYMSSEQLRNFVRNRNDFGELCSGQPVRLSRKSLMFLRTFSENRFLTLRKREGKESSWFIQTLNCHNFYLTSFFLRSVSPKY